MKKISYIFLSFLFVLIVLSCKEHERIAGFEDLEEYTIYDYILENEAKFSHFLAILEKGKLDNTLSSYNPHEQGYTLFLPDNKAIENFISTSDEVSSINDILNDEEYAAEFCRYHVINLGINSGNFPFGAFPKPTLSLDYLTVSFIIQEDTSYYKINNQAGVVQTDIEVSNGFIHLIETALKPINLNSYEWVEANNSYSIIKEAIDLTGFQSRLSINIKESDTLPSSTLLIEPDDIYNQYGIFSIDDLISKISPDNDDYTSPQNPLNNFVGYHILDRAHFIDDFEGDNTNYSTLADIPQNIDGTGIDFAINRGKEIFDTIINQGDTTFIDYVGFFYDNSNVLTQSGVIHIIDQVMRPYSASRAIINFQFFEEQVFNEYRDIVGAYLVEPELNLSVIEWKGADLYFVNQAEQESNAWNDDYIEIDGDFEIAYQVPKIVKGKYKLFLGLEMLDDDNAMIEVFVDGKKLGGFFNLTTGGNANSPFQELEIGSVDFKNYQSHKIEIKSLIPGRLLWDYTRFEPI